MKRESSSDFRRFSRELPRLLPARFAKTERADRVQRKEGNGRKMRTQTGPESGLLIARLIFALGLATVGILLGLMCVGASPSRTTRSASVTATVSSLPTWDIQGSPNLTDQDFTAVTCVSATDCWAVGN